MNVTRSALTLVGVLGVLAALTAVVFAAAAKPDFSVSISPTSQSVQQNGTASFTVTVAAANGFTGTVALAASGVPKGSTSSLTPTSVTLTSSTSTATAQFSVVTSTSTAPGTNTITINANSGNLSHSVTANLTVTQTTNAGYTVGASPGSSTLTPGATAVYSVTVSSTGYSGPVVLSSSGEPIGATWTLSPTTVTVASNGSATSTLQIVTSNSTPVGTYTVTITGSAGGFSQATKVSLVVSTSGKPFTVNASTSGLIGPGMPAVPINLLFSNPNSSALSVTNVTVSISSITQVPGAVGACTAADYSVAQYTGPYPVSVPAGGTANLSAMAASLWPQIRFADSTYNQNGCRGATVNLAVTGSGSSG